MIIELIGGPLDGVIHELRKSWPVPYKFGLPNEEQTERYWYHTARDYKTARYIETERIEDGCTKS